MNVPYQILGTWENVLVFRVTGKLRKSELDRMNKQSLPGIQRLDKVRSLILIEDFLGWDKTDDWGDISFLRNDPSFEKIALVGAKEWEDPVLAFTGKGLRPVEIRYFLPGELALAKAWIGMSPDQAFSKENTGERQR